LRKLSRSCVPMFSPRQGEDDSATGAPRF
jgi:hypothetical protein